MSVLAADPVSRTLVYASPPDVRAIRRQGAVAWSAEVGRDWFAHRLALDRPPSDAGGLIAAFERWDAERHPPEVSRRAVCWEAPVDAAQALLPARFAPTVQLGMVRPPDALSRGAPDPRIRPALGEEVGAVALAQAEEQPALGEEHVRDLSWLYLGLWARGATVWAAWEGARPVAAVTVTASGGEARLRELWTAADRRRQGLGTALVDAVIRTNPGRGLILACVPGSDAHRIYVQAGFEAASRFVTASCDRAAPVR